MIGTIKIFISSVATNLRDKLSTFTSTATVEAEYGTTVVEGSVLTLAHHGERSGRPCPCSLPNLPELGIEAIGLSHVDLDTIGGIMAIMGTKPPKYDWVREFWKVAAAVDVQGPHKLASILETVYHKELVVDALNAWWSFSESSEGRVFAPRDGSAVEVDLSGHFGVITTLLAPAIVPASEDDDADDDDPIYGTTTWDSDERKALIEAGKAWAASKAKLNVDSFVSFDEIVVLRSADSFVNHLYETDGGVAKAVVSFNTKFESITISLADPISGFSVSDFVQKLWGQGAGGHATIGGSPRGESMTRDQAEEAAIALSAALK